MENEISNSTIRKIISKFRQYPNDLDIDSLEEIKAKNLDLRACINQILNYNGLSEFDMVSFSIRNLFVSNKARRVLDLLTLKRMYFNALETLYGNTVTKHNIKDENDPNLQVYRAIQELLKLLDDE